METVATKQMADQALHGETISPTPTTAPQPMITAPQTSTPSQEMPTNG